MNQLRNRMQVMQPVFGLTPGVVLTIPEIAMRIGLSMTDNFDAVQALVQNFIEEEIIAEIYPNCFVMETKAGALPFLLVWSHISEDIYVSNFAALEPKKFAELAQDENYQGFYADEQWPDNFKKYLNDQSASAMASVPYGKSTPVENGTGHELAGTMYTGKNAFFVTGDYEIVRRKLTVTDLFDGTLNNFRAWFPEQHLANEFVAHYTNPENQPQKRRQLRNGQQNGHGSRKALAERSEAVDVMDNVEMSKTAAPADQKLFSLNDIHKMWETIPGFDGTPYAKTLKGHFMDNVLARFV